MIQHLESLESRRLLTNLVAVNVSGGAVSLTDMSSKHVSTGDNFTISYTSTQMVLTGNNGTMFLVGGQMLSTDTITLTGPLSLSMSLNKHANTVSVSGDGTASLSSLIVDMSNGRRGNSVALSQVVADTVGITGGRRNDSVVMSQSTVNDNFSASLGRRPGDSLDLEKTTVKGDVSNQSNQLVMNHSTLLGTFTDSQAGRNSTFQSTDTIYTGAADIQMGRWGEIDMLASADGANQFKSTLNVTGTKRQPTVINADTSSLTTAVAPTLTNATLNGSTTTTQTPPVTTDLTVNSVTNAAAGTPTLTGTFDPVATPSLAVTVGSKTYTLGTDSQLTANGTQWSLQADIVPTTGTYSLPVTATSSNGSGTTKTATGTLSNDQSAISTFLTSKSLTATTTADGLNYVITTQGTGAIPTAGQTVVVNYTGHVINPDGTEGTEFDSNIDSQFGHVSPFSFTLGAKQVIAGWDEAFALLPVGTVAKLLIPSQLAYKDQAQTNIPANSILEFDVTVVSAT